MLSDLRIIQLTYSKFDPVFGGSFILKYYGILDRLPNDIDIFIPMDKGKFLIEVHKDNIRIPETDHKLDWHFIPDLFDYSKPDLIYNKGLFYKIQSPKEIIKYKKDYLDLGYNKYRDKHINDLHNLHFH